MDDIPESYSFENIEQVRAMADELRIRIVDQLVISPMTVTQVGEMLGVPANKIHYHVRELERVGLLQLVETREKGGILEKYYRPVARNFTVPSDLLRSTSPDEIIAAVYEFLQFVNQGLLDALRREINKGTAGVEVAGLSATSYWATAAEAKEMDSLIRKVLDQYVTPRGQEGEREHLFVHFAHTLLSEEKDAGDQTIFQVAQASMPERAGSSAHWNKPRSAGFQVEARLPTARKPKRRRIFAAGALTYTRPELEEIVASGEQLDITVFGSCTFEDDIPSELVERSIVHFRQRGALNAPEAASQP